MYTGFNVEINIVSSNKINFINKLSDHGCSLAMAGEEVKEAIQFLLATFSNIVQLNLEQELGMVVYSAYSFIEYLPSQSMWHIACITGNH